MGELDLNAQNQNENLNQEPAPVNPPVETHPEPEPPVEEDFAPFKNPALNCPACKGEGLIGDPEGNHNICDMCSGVGIV